MSKFLQGEVLKDSKGNVLTDSNGTSLEVGQYVLYPKKVNCKGGRSEMALAVIVGRDQYLQLCREWDDDQTIHLSIEFFRKVKDKVIENTWQTQKEYALPYFETIRGHYLTVVSERFAKGWDDGSIFNS